MTHAKTAKGLWENVQEAWNGIEIKTSNVLIASIEDRRMAVLRNCGRQTRY